MEVWFYTHLFDVVINSEHHGTKNIRKKGLGGMYIHKLSYIENHFDLLDFLVVCYKNLEVRFGIFWICNSIHHGNLILQMIIYILEIDPNNTFIGPIVLDSYDILMRDPALAFGYLAKQSTIVHVEYYHFISLGYLCIAWFIFDLKRDK
ncbi:hypothetical protein ACJX0J_032728 [Zea mays]